MMTLISLAISVAFIFSVAALFLPSEMGEESMGVPSIRFFVGHLETVAVKDLGAGDLAAPDPQAMADVLARIEFKASHPYGIYLPLVMRKN